MADLAHLKKLLGDDDQMVTRFIDLLRAEWPRQILQLSDACRLEDWPTVSAIAHAIKGQAGYLSETALQTQALSIEQETETGLPSGALPEKLAALTSVMQNILDDL